MNFNSIFSFFNFNFKENTRNIHKTDLLISLKLQVRLLVIISKYNV